MNGLRRSCIKYIGRDSCGQFTFIIQLTYTSHLPVSGMDHPHRHVKQIVNTEYSQGQFHMLLLILSNILLTSLKNTKYHAQHPQSLGTSYMVPKIKRNTTFLCFSFFFLNMSMLSSPTYMFYETEKGSR
jgi:hypothetical protein